MIVVDQLQKSFGDREILKKISFSINEGEIFFVLGTSGTGKSVLLKIIVGLLRATSGHISIDGQEVTNLTEDDYQEVRKKCGMVFQQPALFDSLSIYENVAFGIRRHLKLELEEEKKRVDEVLELVNLFGVNDRMPQDISYGMQKRASLARTVAVGPKILLFDEPTTGLDPITTNAINALIRELSHKLKTTSIVVSHDMHCALEIADRIMVLDKGEIVALGTPDQIMKSQQSLVRDFMAEVTK